MKKVIDLSGRRFKLWKVIERAGSDEQKNATWICECDCGNRKTVSGNRLRSGVSVSCGCIPKHKTEGGHLNWKGGVGVRNGYVTVNNRLGKQEKMHRIIMEHYLDRKLNTHEVVHHINHNKLDNRIENLSIMGRADHANLHAAQDFLYAQLCYNPLVEWKVLEKQYNASS